MKFNAFYDKNVKKQLEKLPKQVAKRIVRRIGYVEKNGKGFERLYDEKYGYKIRVGDYRVLLDIDFSDRLLLIRYVEHRGKVYRRLR